MPVIVVCLTMVAGLIAPFFSVRRSNVVCGIVAIAGLLAAFITTIVVHATNGPIFRGLLTFDPAGVFWNQLLLIFVVGVILIWFGSTRAALGEGDGPEFFTLLLGATVGMMLMGSTSHLLMLLLATEIASMPSYVLAGFRKTRRLPAEAALKFVLFGAVCTAVMIYGMSMLYGMHGSLEVTTIAASIGSRGVDALTIIGLIGVLVGLLFKLSAVPFHFWCPDVFEGSHADVAAFLSVASKGAGVVLLARLATILCSGSPTLSTGISVTLAAVAIVTMTIGNFGALQQVSLKRLLAYSSIAHAGYIIAAIAMTTPAHAGGALTAVGLYLAVYVAMNLGAFAVVADVDTQTGSDRLEQFNGLAARAPLAALGMSAALLSMVGLPPFAGLLAKWKIMAVLASAGGWWWAVVVAVGLNSIVSLAYYARVIRAMYLRPSVVGVKSPGAIGGIIAVASAAALVLMFVFFGPLERTSARLADQPNARQTP
jgi:NADH-quinone oxidoreductase subunit N